MYVLAYNLLFWSLLLLGLVYVGCQSVIIRVVQYFGYLGDAGYPWKEMSLRGKNLWLDGIVYVDKHIFREQVNVGNTVLSGIHSSEGNADKKGSCRA